MNVRADADIKFIRKYLLLAAAGLGFLLWGSYDEFIRFPKKLEEARAFDPIREDPDAVIQWAKLYEANKDRGWHQDPPHDSAAVIEGNIQFNRFVILGGLCLMTFFLVKYFRSRGSWMESNEDGITTSWGDSLQFDKVTQINKRRWEQKGIAKVQYTDADGKNRTMVFDDYKYQREPMGELMTMCERNLDRSKIVGGKSQAEIAAAKAAEAFDDAEDQDADS